MTEKLHKTDEQLLKKFIKQNTIAMDSIDKCQNHSINVLLSNKLIQQSRLTTDDIYNNSYSITSKGKRYFKDKREDKFNERKIHIWYPTIVNIIWGVVGFFIGWFLRASFH